MRKNAKTKLGNSIASNIFTSKFVRASRRALQLTKVMLKFVAFQEDNPVHHVWLNPSIVEFTVWCFANMFTGVTVGVWFFLHSPIPFITVFGNILFGEFIGFFTVLEMCHVAWDRPASS